jgi:hypothetical protein
VEKKALEEFFLRIILIILRIIPKKNKGILKIIMLRHTKIKQNYVVVLEEAQTLLLLGCIARGSGRGSGGGSGGGGDGDGDGQSGFPSCVDRIFDWGRRVPRPRTHRGIVVAGWLAGLLVAHSGELRIS